MKARRTSGSTGAAQPSFLRLIDCYMRGPVIPTVRCYLLMKRGLYAILIVVQLSSAALSQTDEASEKVRTGTRYKNTLAVFREPEIFPRTTNDSEVYRILVTATFYHPVIIRIESNGTQSVLNAKWLSGQVGYDWGTFQGEKTRNLTEKEWRRLNQLLNRASFWTTSYEQAQPQPNEKGEETVCLDGVDWFLEGSARGTYHVVDRYCPDEGAFKAVGMYMVKLARLNIGLRLK
jgi:hypothetical protein